MSRRDGSVLDVVKIVDNGSASQRWDLVILGDGFPRGEIAVYQDQVTAVVDRIFATAPFDRLHGAINVHRVDVASDEKGAGDLCRNVRRKTFFNANFCAQQLDRLLVADDALAVDVAIESVPEMNATLLLVNSETYGGSGGAVPVFSLAQDAFEIALHEMGHSHFGLADEYPYLSHCHEPGHARYSGNEPAEPNVTSTLQPLKWQRLVTPGAAIPTTRNANCDDCDPQPNPMPDRTVGAYDGARYFRCGMFRPEFNCRMRELGAPFCAVCQDTIARVLSPFLPPALPPAPVPVRRRPAHS
ncbi:MAG TPA: M64 family metallopeptidase [Thermoanaerobaculia bacterium]